MMVFEVSCELKVLGVGIYFEEQNINILFNEGEGMFLVFVSLVEEEL